MITKPKTKDNIRNHSSCDDDEDCLDGSGDSSTAKNLLSSLIPDMASTIPTSREEAFSTQNDTLITTEETMTQYPMTTSSYMNGSTTEINVIDYSVSTPTIFETTTSFMTGQKNNHQSSDYPQTHLPVPTPPKTKELPKVPTIHSDASKNAALIIAIIAGALIAIVLIILLILKFKNRPENNFKIDKTKIFNHDPNSALLSATNNDQQFDCAPKLESNISKNGRKRELKDIKEWYV
ncbi:GSCOCG00011526001-RA-CDS [Cotesia congregata]|nr:GSCOCG00011526001-RA-CDS [Cotesia congregata]